MPRNNSVLLARLVTTWKVFKCGVISGLYFPIFRLNTEVKTGKNGPEITPYLDTFHAVSVHNTSYLTGMNQVQFL